MEYHGALQKMSDKIPYQVKEVMLREAGQLSSLSKAKELIIELIDIEIRTKNYWQISACYC